MRSFVTTGAKYLVIPCIALGASQALAQVAETEPNDTCEAAQIIGAIDATSPLTATGSLDTPPEVPDIDFFRFEATPDALLEATLEGADTGQGTLPDPLLGLFDSDCDLLALSDDSGSFNSRLVFVVPADGAFVMAASSFGDDKFTGAGFFSGSYALTISPAPPPIGSIAGRVIDATSGEPLPGNSPPFASVELLRCDGVDCLDLVGFQNTDDEGRFRFERDAFDQPLLAGTYQIVAFAIEFEPSSTGPFDVGEGEDLDLGDIPLALPAISFSDAQPCNDLLPQGDTCRYSVKITNNTGAPIQGLAWSFVDGFGLGSDLTFTFFEASTERGSRRVVRQRVALEPFGDQELRFRFDVPPFALGATFCTSVVIGVDPNPLVIPIRRSDQLFCVAGDDGGFQVMSQGETQKISKALSAKSGISRKFLAR